MSSSRGERCTSGNNDEKRVNGSNSSGSNNSNNSICKRVNRSTITIAANDRSSQTKRLTDQGDRDMTAAVSSPRLLTPEEARTRMAAIDVNLTAAAREPLVGDILKCLGKRNREKAFRSSSSRSHAGRTLQEGSRVCIEAWGTVAGTTRDGDALVVLDSQTHPGFLVAPKDTKLVSIGCVEPTQQQWEDMCVASRAAVDVADEMGMLGYIEDGDEDDEIEQGR